MPLTAQPPSQALIDLVGTLGGEWHGRTAMCRCPAHADGTPSLSLRQGDRGILVTCFAGCEREDVLRELGRVRLGRHFPQPERVQASRRANVERLWDEALPADVGLGGRYLVQRHFARLPLDLRFHPRCPHGPKPRTRFKPAILVAVRQDRTLVAVQRIFLDPRSGSYTEKLMLGVPGDGAWRGREPGATLAIGEGFETAQAFALLHDVPCWASLGARRLDQIRFPASVRTLLIAEDNDAEGRRASRRACEHYSALGLDVRRAPPPARFKDWAEVLEEQVKRGGRSNG